MQQKQKRKQNSRSRHRIDSVHFNNIFDNHINFRERVIYFNLEVGEYGLDLIHKALDEFDSGENPQPVKIVVSSYGGSVYDMMGIVDRIRASKCHIMTYGSGKIMSAATFILAAGDERVMTANSWFMMHEMSDWIRGSMQQMRLEMKHNEDLELQMYKMYESFSVNNTKWTTFRKLCKKDHYIRAQNVLELGLIDKIQGMK